MKNKKGFTLVEIIVVLVILAILAAIAVPAVLGYVDDAKEARELAKLRESLIAAQVTFTKSAAFGESGKSDGKAGESNNRFLTENQVKDIMKGLDLEIPPYVLMYGTGDPDVYGATSTEASKVYCIIYQKDANSKPWYYDGKKWSHRYLWQKKGGANETQQDSTRAMYTSNQIYDKWHNYMRDVKDRNDKDTAVSMYYVYVNKTIVDKDPGWQFWGSLRNASE